MILLGDPVTNLSSHFMSLFLLILALMIINIFHKLWWTPTRIQKFMGLQGIKGPSYRLIHGNAKEISNMKKESMSKPKSNLSHDTFSQVLPHMHSWTKKYGKNYLQWHGFQAQLVITEPELCKEILNDKDGAYPKRKPPTFSKKLLGDGLLTTPKFKKWAKLRKLANHAFHGESLKSMIPAMVTSADSMLQRWKSYEGKEIEVFEEFRLFTSELISKTAFGSSYLEGQYIFEMLMKLSFLIHKNRFTIRFPGISKFYKTSDEIQGERIEKGMRNVILEMIKKREKAVSGEEESFGSDYLGLLLKAHHDADDNTRISVDDIINECKTFYLAGQQTTNALLAWTVLLLALHSDWQDEARKEVLELFGKDPPNPDGIAKLKTMSMILNESLRLYPPVVSLMIRKTKKEARHGNLIIPADIELMIPTLAIHHEPELWGPNVQHFKPERFSEGVAKATKSNTGAFIPFGMGPRTCVGMNFATTEVKIALSMILQRYSFTISPAYIHSPFHFITLCPQHGVHVILHPLALVKYP